MDFFWGGRVWGLGLAEGIWSGTGGDAEDIVLCGPIY